jgi:hypothetical protein
MHATAQVRPQAPRNVASILDSARELGIETHTEEIAGIGAESCDVS